MTGQMWGQDVEQVRDLARRFARSAQELETARDLVDGAVMGFDGWGPNVDEMRETWAGDLAPSLTVVAEALRGAGEKASANADAQEGTSESYSGGSGGGSPFAGASGTGSGEVEPAGDDDGGGISGWFGDRMDDISGAVDWVGDKASDLGGWLSDRGDAIVDSWANVVDSGGQLWDATGGAILDGEWPRTTEVVASAIRLGGATIGAGLTNVTFGMFEPNVFDDGDPYAGEPRAVNPDTMTVPQGVDDLARTVTDAYQAGDGTVRVTTVESPEGPRVIVSVPGTESWNPSTGDNPMDLTGNLVTAGGGESTMTQAVELAMQNADIPPGAEVMLVGHSQGGMTVADLVSDPDFVSEHNVTNAMTFGSPVDSADIDPRVDVLEVQHGADVVPRLDLGDSRFPLLPGSPDGGPNHTEVTLDNPSSWYDAAGNHSHQNYADSLGSSSDPGLLAYQEQLRENGFLGGDPSSTSAQDIHVGRRS